jgi:hypothetical protein
VGQDPGSVSSIDVRNRKEASVVSLDNGIDARRLVLLMYGLFIAASKQFERAASLWLVVIDLSWKTKLAIAVLSMIDDIDGTIGTISTHFG